MNGERLLYTDAVLLALFGVGGLIADLAGYIFGTGPLGAVLHRNPLAIGATEAHGLACLMALVLWRRGEGVRFRHGLAASTHALLGACNLLYWGIFTQNGLVSIGVVTTLLHGALVLANLAALQVRVRRPA